MLIAAIFGTLTMGSPAWSQVTGRVQVVDGDTLKVGQQLVGLFGVDAPESKQSCVHGRERWPCGHHAREALRNYIGENRVECFGAEHDRYGRLLEVCLISPLTKSLFVQSVSGSTMMASIAGLPLMFATMAIARATSD